MYFVWLAIYEAVEVGFHRYAHFARRAVWIVAKLKSKPPVF